MTQLSLLPSTSNYFPMPGAWDEMSDVETGVRPHWAHLVEGLKYLDAHDWSVRNQRIVRLLRENGVTYHVYNDPRGYTRTWELDPIPLVLDGGEWRQIEAGLEQRARLLDLILRDLYGPQTLLKRGLLPPDLIFAHTGYLRPLLGALPNENRQLIFYAADLARGPDGQVWVMADRTQAPSGAGYAMENRAVMSRTFPELLEGAGVAKLNHWLDAVQLALYSLAPEAGRDDPHVVILTPGPANETYFEHAYIAARLGFSLAQGNDLTVRDGKVWLKSVSGLRRVDVILRRVDASWCDPLELRQDSYLGVPGLVECVRRGNVALANPLRAGVLENPALMPFLPGLSKALLDEELKLPMAATWWCGQEKERDYVLANLADLVIKPIYRGTSTHTVLGSQLDRKQLGALRDRIKAHPHLYVGQQPLALSTVPALQGGRLIPLGMSLRSFLVSHGEGYAAMPGGLTRCSRENLLSSQHGALSKDTWVSPGPPKPVHLAALKLSTLQSKTQANIGLDGESLTSRSADNLFWAGRYLERGEAVSRLLRAVLDGLWEEEITPGLEPVLAALMRMIGCSEHHCRKAIDAKQPENLAEEVRELLTGDSHSGNLANSVRALLACAYSTREYWSVAIWRLLDRIERDWGKRPRRRHRRGHERTDLWLGRLIDSLAGLAGLASETLPRDAAFRFFDLGRRVERGLSLITLLTELLQSPLDDEAERESLSLALQSADTLVSFRRRFRSEPFMGGVLALLVWDSDSPRSLLFQIETARQHLAELPHETRGAEAILSSAEARIGALKNKVDTNVSNTRIRQELVLLLAEMTQHLLAVSNTISHIWFTHVQESRAMSALNPNHSASTNSAR